jgi:hypothetical protein
MKSKRLNDIFSQNCFLYQVNLLKNYKQAALERRQGSKLLL